MLYEYAWTAPFVGDAIGALVSRDEFVERRLTAGLSGDQAADLKRSASAVISLAALRTEPLLSMAYSLAMLIETLARLGNYTLFDHVVNFTLADLLLVVLVLYVCLMIIARQECDAEKTVREWRLARFASPWLYGITHSRYVLIVREMMIVLSFAVTYVAVVSGSAVP